MIVKRVDVSPFRKEVSKRRFQLTAIGKHNIIASLDSSMPSFSPR